MVWWTNNFMPFYFLLTKDGKSVYNSAFYAPNTPKENEVNRALLDIAHRHEMQLYFLHCLHMSTSEKERGRRKSLESDTDGHVEAGVLGLDIIDAVDPSALVLLWPYIAEMMRPARPST